MLFQDLYSEHITFVSWDWRMPTMQTTLPVYLPFCQASLHLQLGKLFHAFVVIFVWVRLEYSETTHHIYSTSCCLCLLTSHLCACIPLDESISHSLYLSSVWKGLSLSNWHSSSWKWWYISLQQTILILYLYCRNTYVNVRSGFFPASQIILTKRCAW